MSRTRWPTRGAVARSLNRTLIKPWNRVEIIVHWWSTWHSRKVNNKRPYLWYQSNNSCFFRFKNVAFASIQYHCSVKLESKRMKFLAITVFSLIVAACVQAVSRKVRRTFVFLIQNAAGRRSFDKPAQQRRHHGCNFVSPAGRQHDGSVDDTPRHSSHRETDHRSSVKPSGAEG